MSILVLQSPADDEKVGFFAFIVLQMSYYCLFSVDVLVTYIEVLT